MVELTQFIESVEFTQFLEFVEFAQSIEFLELELNGLNELDEPERTT